MPYEISEEATTATLSNRHPLTGAYQTATRTQIHNNGLTGLAIMNLETPGTDVLLELCAQDGHVIATAPNIRIEGYGQLARMAYEISWTANVDLSNFSGLLKAHSSGSVAATAIRTRFRKSQLSTLPVAGLIQ